MDTNVSSPPSSDQESIKNPSARRSVLLASAACVTLAVFAAGAAMTPRPDAGYAAEHAGAIDRLQPAAGFANLVARVKPAVISVQVTIEQAVDATGFDQSSKAAPPEPGAPLEKFFEQFGIPQPPVGGSQNHLIITGEGSGFFVSPDGYAVTNYHVVDHAKTVQVTTDDGKKLTARVVGVDRYTDLALIKVEGAGFSHVTFASKEPRIGDWVVAVGNPFGLGGTVTAGIVSARGRDLGSSPYDDFIQIDAPINKGNSGGPTFDLTGQVVGVNTAIFSPSGGSIGIGFDIPAATAKEVVAQLEAKGVVTRGWIGVQVQPVNAEIADSVGLKVAQGALVSEPQAGGPAGKAGVKSGDVITSVNGQAVQDSRDLARRIGSMAPGTSVRLGIWRNEHEREISLVLGQLPEDRQAQAGDQREVDQGAGASPLGLTLAPASSVPGIGSEGVVVVALEASGPAAERGINAGDVILEVNGEAVSTAADVQKGFAAVERSGKHFALVRVRSGEATRFIALPVAHA